MHALYVVHTHSCMLAHGFGKCILQQCDCLTSRFGARVYYTRIRLPFYAHVALILDLPDVTILLIIRCMIKRYVQVL